MYKMAHQLIVHVGNNLTGRRMMILPRSMCVSVNHGPVKYITVPVLALTDTTVHDRMASTWRRRYKYKCLTRVDTSLFVVVVVDSMRLFLLDKEICL